MLRSIASLFFHVLITKNRAKVKEPQYALFFHFFKRINMSLRSAILSFSVLFYSSLSCRGTLYLYLGPTFSGKTTSLINDCRDERDKDKNVLCFRHEVTRDGNTEALDCQKEGLREPGIILSNDNYKELILKETKQSRPDIVIIDEVSFFPEEFAQFIYEKLLFKGIDVYCAGMEIGVERQIFPGAIKNLIDTAKQQELEEELVLRRFQSVCHHCKKILEQKKISLNDMPRNAPYMNRLIYGEPANIANKIIPGCRDENGNPIVEYVPTCIKHYVRWNECNASEAVLNAINTYSLN